MDKYGNSPANCFLALAGTKRSFFHNQMNKKSKVFKKWSIPWLTSRELPKGQSMKRSWHWNILYDEASRETRGRTFLIPFLSTFAPKIIIIDKGGSKFESENKVELHIWVKAAIEGGFLISIDDLTKVPSSTHWGSNCMEGDLSYNSHLVTFR